MFSNNTIRAYKQANRVATFDYIKSVGRGRSANLPTLDSITCNINFTSKLSLGLKEIPLKKIIGTYMHSRSISFTNNFMPLLSENTEFAEKWKTLYESHMDVGINEPIKVFEYLNWFYVEEGNKRVSVLKFVDAFSVKANVYRLLPDCLTDENQLKIYYEFIRFNEKTNIFDIWFSKQGSFLELLDLLEDYHPKDPMANDKYKHFMFNVYYPFRKIFFSYGGFKQKLTTADALLEYLRLYKVPQSIGNKDKQKVLNLIPELNLIAKKENVEIHTGTKSPPKKRIISSLIGLVKPPKKLKVAFAYSKTIKASGWTYTHEVARLKLEQDFKHRISTSFVENVPSGEEAYSVIKSLVESGNDIIFTTNPSLHKASLKIALEYPKMKIMNCSASHFYKKLRTYYPRVYEVKFLLGMLAGIMTKKSKIAYIAKVSLAEEITGINAFALGVMATNIQAKTDLFWDDSNIDWESYETIFYDSFSRLSNKNFRSGLFHKDKKIASVKLDWSVFYHQIIQTILTDNWDIIFKVSNARHKLLNFWWGLSSGLVDISFEENVIPQKTKKFIHFIKKMIIQNEYHPFDGDIYDQFNQIKFKKSEAIKNRDIVTMDWLVDGINGKTCRNYSKKRI